jgi:hypothetical protein
MSQLHVYVKIRMVWSDDEGRSPDRPEVWGVVLAPPEGARQVSPSLWLAEEDGMRFEYHGPVPVPGT